MLDIALAVLFITFCIATYTDLRWTEVPDWLSYSTIIAALALHGIESITTASAWPLASSLLGLATYAALGLSLFYLGQWGGGDAKLLMGTGAMLTFTTHLTSPFILYPLLLLTAGGVYSALWTAVVALRNIHDVHAQLRILYTQRGLLTTQRALIISAVLIGLGALILPLPTEQTVAILLLCAALPLLLALFVLLRAIEHRCFRTRTTAHHLIEGDWIIEPVTQHGKTLYTPTNTGISADDINTLRAHNVTNILIKTGIPFIPSFLLALIPLFFI